MSTDALLFASPDTPQAAKRDTKSIGLRSEMRVALALIERGWTVSLPLGENARYDLVADDGTGLQRIQVKTGRLRNGVVVFAGYSSHSHRKGPFSRPYHGQIDAYAVYCPQTEKVYLVPASEIRGVYGSLRVDPPVNNMKKRVRYAAPYELP